MLAAIAWVFVIGAIVLGLYLAMAGLATDEDFAVGIGCAWLTFGIACVVVYCFI